MPAHEQNLIWIDLEMTGLDPDADSILEIATLVTDSQLNVLAEGPELAIAHPLARLEAMDEWKELARRWAPSLLEGGRKVGAHTALSDIRESVKELAHYRQHMGKLAGL